jgi:phosphoribosyl 1,2-cyclic phosphodiesterase
VLGCECAVCRSDDPRDRRTRSGALLELPEGRLLVDTPPELRVQLLRERVATLDAVWITHTHADHLHAKLRAAADPARRRSKRLQDLADAQSLLEQDPALEAELSDADRASLSGPLPS